MKTHRRALLSTTHIERIFYFRSNQRQSLAKLITTCTICLALVSLGVSSCAAPTKMDKRPSETTQPKAAPAQTATPFQVTPTQLALKIDASPTAAIPSSPTAKVVTLPPPTSPACLAEGGVVITATLRTKQLPLPLEYRVYQPPCYEEQAPRRYPVLFLIHGQSYTDDQWDRLGANETADRLIAAGQIAPLIIVMPRDRLGGEADENNFAKVIVEELLPLLDRTYRTLTDRQHRAVGGLSRGAGWAIHLAIAHWELFGALGTHSPAVFHTDAQRMRVLLDAIPPDDYPRVWIDVGDKDRPEILYDSAIWFEKLLNEKDIPHDWYLFSGYHEEAYWRRHMEKYLRWYTQNW